CIGSEYSVSRTIVDHTVSQRYVMSMMVDSSKAAARDIKTFENVMIRQSKLNCICATSNNWSQSIDANPTNRDFVYVRSGSGENKVAWISRVAIDLCYVSRVEQRSDFLKCFEGPCWTNLISNGIGGADAAARKKKQCSNEVFHAFS